MNFKGSRTYDPEGNREVKTVQHNAEIQGSHAEDNCYYGDSGNALDQANMENPAWQKENSVRV